MKQKPDGVGSIMKTFSIPPVEIPIAEFASQGNAILGIKSSGKTYGATCIAEKLMDAGIPIIAFDPIGVWRNLKVPGKGKGYPVVVAHPEDGDLPLTPHSAPEIVRAALRHNVSLILDLYSIKLSKADWRNIVEQSTRILLHENKDTGVLRHLFIEEASEFCPQRIQPDQGRVYAEIEKLSRMGGNVSLGYTLINQRAEEVNKAVLEICDCLILHRQKGRNSLTSLGKWLDFSDSAMSKKIIHTMPTLEPGQCWIWPQDAEIPTLCRFPTKSSFHPDRKHPAKIMAGKPADVSAFVAQLAQSLEKVLEEAKQNDPAELKKRIRQLERTFEIQATEVRTVEVKVPALSADEIHKLQKLHDSFSDCLSKMHPLHQTAGEIVNIMERVIKTTEAQKMAYSSIVQPPQRKLLAQPQSNTNGIVRGGLRRMMIALAQRPGLNKSQLGVRAGLSSKSGTFSTYLGRLRTNGWLEGAGDCMKLSENGLTALGQFDPLPEGKSLYEYWLGELGNSGAARMLSALYAAHPRRLSKQELGEAAVISHTSGTFGTYMGTLRRLELIEGRGEFGVAKELL